MTDSPSEEFLKEILERALDAIGAGRYDHIYDVRSGRKVVWHLDRDLERLDACCPASRITEEDDYWGIVQDCLEAALCEPLQTYKQPEEHICTNKEAAGLEMFAFVVALPDFTRPIYTKFCLKEQSDGTWYVSIDCHT